MFLRVKQGLVLEVDVQHGRERCRLELCSLARVETTEAAWSRGVEVGKDFDLYRSAQVKKKKKKKFI